MYLTNGKVCGQRLEHVDTIRASSMLTQPDPFSQTRRFLLQEHICKPPH